MPIERAAVLRNAEKLVRQGKVDLAIAEYLRVVEADPLDWSTANLLGDLYIRVGQVDPAIAQFVRIAEQLRSQGFLPKASAVYKKVLKITPDDERAMLRAAEIAGELGLLADARVYLSALGDRRRRRGDAQGVSEVIVRLGALDDIAAAARREAALPAPEDAAIRGGVVEAQMAAAPTPAASLEVALHEAGRSDSAVPLLASASRAPGLRFAAAALVGRIHRDRGDQLEAVEWFERAAQAPAPTSAEGMALLYELADVLEQTGEVSRALAICIELQSEAGPYRDVAERIDRLFKAQPRG